MFKVLGKSFLDAFRRPFTLLFLLFFLILYTIGFSILYNFTEEYLFNSSDLIVNTLSLLINHLGIFLLYIAWFLIVAYIISAFVAYVINKKSDLKENFKGTSKIFGFALFLALITYIPMYIFAFFNSSLTASILFMLLSLFYVFLVYPFVFFVPVLLPSMTLKESLSKSFNFAKKHYGWLIVLQILFVVVITLLSNIIDLLSIVDEFLGLLLFIIIFTILVLWGLNFTHNWFYSEQ